MANHLSARPWSECRVALLWLAKRGGGGRTGDLDVKEHKGTMRDGSQPQGHSVQSCALTPSSVI